MHRRHRFYRHIFGACLLVMACMPLPSPFMRLAIAGTVVLLLLLSFELGQPVRPRQRRRHWSDVVYSWTGVAGLLVQILWMVSPATFAVVGFPLLVVIMVFIFWSLKRLLICLAQESRIGMPVLAGAGRCCGGLSVAGHQWGSAVWCDGNGGARQFPQQGCRWP